MLAIRTPGLVPPSLLFLSLSLFLHCHSSLQFEQFLLTLLPHLTPARKAVLFVADAERGEQFKNLHMMDGRRGNGFERSKQKRGVRERQFVPMPILVFVPQRKDADFGLRATEKSSMKLLIV